MAKVTNGNETETKEINNTIEEKNNQIQIMQSQIDKLEGMLQAFIGTVSNNKPQIIDTTSKMDRPVTLIHMLECHPGLPTVIEVNGNSHYFSKFGETRTFRFAEMQNIISRYRDWLVRGVFTLADDCTEYQEELGIHIAGNQIPVEIYNKIETLSLKEFESLVKNLVDVQRIGLVRNWIAKYQQNQPGYDNLDRIRILNKYSKDKTIFKQGMLSELIKDVIDEE